MRCLNLCCSCFSLLPFIVSIFIGINNALSTFALYSYHFEMMWAVEWNCMVQKSLTTSATTQKHTKKNEKRKKKAKEAKKIDQVRWTLLHCYALPWCTSRHQHLKWQKRNKAKQWKSTPTGILKYICEVDDGINDGVLALCSWWYRNGNMHNLPALTYCLGTWWVQESGMYSQLRSNVETFKKSALIARSVPSSDSPKKKGVPE